VHFEKLEQRSWAAMTGLSRATRALADAADRWRRSARHGAVLLLTLLAAAVCGSGPALAGAVTAPSGGTHSALNPLTVQWNGIAISNGVAAPVGVALTIISNNSYAGVMSVPVATNVANTGQYVIPASFLRALFCESTGWRSLLGPSPTIQWEIHAGVGAANAGAGYTIGPAFKIKCPFVGGAALDHGVIGAAVVPSGGGHPFSGGSLTQGSAVAKGGALARPEGQGALNIYKSVGYTAGFPVPPNFPTFAMTVNCTPYGPANQAVSVPTTNAGLTLTGVGAGSACTVTEAPLPPIAHAPGCGGGPAYWMQAAPASATIAAGATTRVTMSNWIACGYPTGWTALTKTVVNHTGAPTPTSFAATAHCTGPHGPLTRPLSVPVNGAVSFGSDAGSTCSVTEAPLASIPNAPGCNGASASWTTSYAPQQVVTSVETIQAIRITNTLACDQSKGSLKVVKSVVNATGGPAPIPATFPMTVDCTSPGPAHQAVSVAPGGAGSTIANIPAQAYCTVTEAALGRIGRVQGCNGGTASWATVVGPAQGVTISANGVATVTVRNTLTCDKPPATGTLTVYKRVVNATGGPMPVLPKFHMTAHCTPSEPLNAPVSVGANQGVSLAAPIVANSSCRVTEPRLAAIAGVKACKGATASWTTTYSPTAIVPAGGNATLTVTNTLACDKPPATGTLTLIKRVVVDGPIPPPNMPFVILVNCPPNGPNTTVTLSSANGYQQTVQGVAAGGSCITTEQPPAVPADLARRGCHWETEGPAGGPKTTLPTGSNTTRVFVNRWVCKPGTGTGTGGKGTDLSIRKTGGGSVGFGGTVSFVLTVSNNGPGSVGAGGAVITDPLPPGFSLVSASGSGWSCGGAQTVTCTYNGPAVGPNSPFPPITVMLAAKTIGGFENCASVRYTGGTDGVAGNNRGCVGFTVQRGPSPPPGVDGGPVGPKAPTRAPERSDPGRAIPGKIGR
jgi:uncharacterized repeat protein (TIGR01451 family)